MSCDEREPRVTRRWTRSDLDTSGGEENEQQQWCLRQWQQNHAVLVLRSWLEYVERKKRHPRKGETGRRAEAETEEDAVAEF